MQQLDWTLLEADDGRADALHGRAVQLSGWWQPPEPGMPPAYGLLRAEAPCCGGGAADHPLRTVEVWLHAPLPLDAGALTLRGRWQRLHDDPAGWRWCLRSARPVAQGTAGPPPAARPGRRLFLAASASLGLVACSAGRFAAYAEAGQDAAAQPAEAEATRAWLAQGLTIDMHSHAGRVIVSRNPAIGANRPFAAVVAPMREGGMQLICLAIVTDTVVTRVSANRKRFEAFRAPAPGELYALSQTEFARAAALIEREQLQVLTRADELDTLPARGPTALIASEGADFLEGRLDRVDEAYHQHRLRHLQLTHYRVNELGDIQTEVPVHGGLTDFGAAVVRRCNALGMVVDVAHGTYDLVRRAAAVTTRPLVLSHTSLSEHPSPRSRQITADHARAVADTGGVIGVWPSGGVFSSLDAMARGARRLADVVGVNHVGLGSDLLGFISPPVLQSYRQLPQYAAALLRAGFSQTEAAQVLGGNYRRVAQAALVPDAGAA